MTSTGGELYSGELYNYGLLVGFTNKDVQKVLRNWTAGGLGFHSQTTSQPACEYREAVLR